MYIKLIQPKMELRPMDTETKTRMSPPLGLYTIVSLFRDKHKVIVQNENVEDVAFDSPDIVGITISLDALPRAIEICRKFTAKNIPVIAGGVHVTTAYSTIPKGIFSALCIGAAEGTWPQIIDDLSKGELKRIYKCPSAFTGKDIVSPAYDLIPPGIYLYRNIIHTSRGCPFKCDFCYNSFWEHRFVHREIDDVIREIKSFKQKHIMIIDDNFIGNPKWTMELLAEYSH